MKGGFISISYRYSSSKLHKEEKDGLFVTILSKFSREKTFFIPLFLAAANACWVAGFDIIYGAQDVEFDRSFGVQSIPAKFGIKNALHISTLLHLLVVLFLFLVGWMVEGFEWLYFMGLLLITVLLIIEHKVVKPTNLAIQKLLPTLLMK